MKTGESGFVLVMVVIQASLASILAAGLYMASAASVGSATRTIRFEKAFAIAEAGAERAKAELVNISLTNSLNTVLIGADGQANTGDDGRLSFCSAGSAVSFGDGTYSVRISNNTNSDPDPFVDTDNTVIIRSTGTYENIQRMLELAVTVSSNASPPGDNDGALAIYGTNSTVNVGGSSIIDGNDWALPANFDCTGAGCDGSLTTNPAQPGVFSTTNATIVGTNRVYGDPPVTNNATGNYDEQYWQDQVDYWTPLATLSITGNVPNGTSLGTRANPQITLATADVQINGNTGGAGVLIVLPDVDITISGTFHYEGLVILLGDVECTALGTADIFGALVALGGGNEVKLNGNPVIKYSTQALSNLIKLPLPGPLSVLSWREVKQ